jgi:hypothetical protein
MQNVFSRLALTTALLGVSLTVWTAVAGASRYIDRDVTRASQVNPSGRGGFDWLDAGIGAAATVGVGLVVGGACVLVLKHRRAAAFS